MSVIVQEFIETDDGFAGELTVEVQADGSIDIALAVESEPVPTITFAVDGKTVHTERSTA